MVKSEKSVAVIGAGIGGLTAALELAVMGYKVKLFEARSGVGGKAMPISMNGFVFDPGPSIVILPDIYERLINRAGERMEDWLKLVRLDPTTRVLHQGETIDLPSSIDALVEVARQINPSDANALELIIDRFDKWVPLIQDKFFSSTIEQPYQLLDSKLIRFGMEFGFKQTYRERVDLAFQSPIFRALFYGFPSYSGLTYHTKSPAPWFIPYFMLKNGVFAFEGGIRSLVQALEGLCKKKGVEFFLNDRVESVAESGRKLKSVTASKSGIHEVDAVVCNADYYSFASLLGRQMDLEPSLSYVTLQLGVRNPSQGLACHNLVIQDEYVQGFERLYDAKSGPSWEAAYINAPYIHDPEGSPAGCGQYFFVYPCPAELKSGNWETIQAQLWATSRQVLAQFGHDLQDEDILAELVQTPQVFESRDGNFKGSLFGLDESTKKWGLAPGCCDKQFRNLFYCGSSVQPGAGMPMVCLSGTRCANLLDKQLKGSN